MVRSPRWQVEGTPAPLREPRAQDAMPGQVRSFALLGVFWSLSVPEIQCLLLSGPLWAFEGEGRERSGWAGAVRMSSGLLDALSVGADSLWNILKFFSRSSGTRLDLRQWDLSNLLGCLERWVSGPQKCCTYIGLDSSPADT